MRLSKVLSEEQRAVRFTGKKRKMDMERNGVLETGRSQQIKSTLDNLMGGHLLEKVLYGQDRNCFLRPYELTNIGWTENRWRTKGHRLQPK